MRFDYLIVGSGLFGSVCAYELTKEGYSVLVVDKRDHIGGNIYTENIEGINVHKYGAHIFHTSDEFVWNYIKQFANFNNFINSPIADYNGEKFNLPFNMNTFCQIWPEIKMVDDAKAKILEEQLASSVLEPKNLEQQALNLVGRTIFNKLIKGYTEKQWGKPCDQLPAFIIKRIPLRFEFNNNYFDDKYQGIPIGGYTQIIQKMLEKSTVRLNCDYLKNKNELESIANKIIYTGPIDEFFNYKFGHLEYRSLRFEEKILNQSNYQGNAVVNYTSNRVPYTRIIEHKYFEMSNSEKTIITKEYPVQWDKTKIPYYTVNDQKNLDLYKKYLDLSKNNENVFFGGRLGLYKYLDMDDTIIEALKLVNKLTNS